MYTEENEKRGFPFRDFLLKLILIIVFVLLLVWLVPWPKGNSNGYDFGSLKAQIFNSNLQTMKEAAITYFTTDRLPVNVGDRKTLTLQEMLDMKLLVPFVDKDGKSCDIVNSYVTLEKGEKEYIMKVNLKCSSEEDYILVHLGCYSYCEGAICEKKTEPTVKPTGNGNNGGTKPTNRPQPTGNPSPTSTVKPDPTPTNKPSPTNSPSPSPTNSPNPSPTNSPKPDANKEYQYKKYNNTVYSAWTDWKTYTYKDSDNIKFGNTATKEVVDLGSKYVQIGTKAAEYQYYAVTRTEEDVVDRVTYKVCTNWKYIISRSTTTTGGSTTGGTSVVKRVTSDWHDTGKTYSGYNVPNDTETVRWVYVGIDYDKCGNTCTNHPYIIWKQQARTVSTVTTSTGAAVTPPTAGSTITDVNASCTSYENRTLDVVVQRQKTKTYKEKISDAQPIYGYVKFYKVRARQIVQAAYTQYTWSHYDDTKLLGNGYTYTGKTRNK